MKPFKPSITASAPDDWFVKESITLLRGDGEANVICSSEPLDERIDSQAYADVQGELLREEFPHFTEIDFLPIKAFGGHDAFARLFEWTPDDGVPVTQIQLYWAHGARGYTATATCPSSAFEASRAGLESVLTSLVVNT